MGLLRPTADWFERRAPQGRRSGRARASEGEQHAAMPNPFNEFFGVGASLRATGLAARKARMDAGDGGSREGRGSATRDAWPLPLLGESAGERRSRR